MPLPVGGPTVTPDPIVLEVSQQPMDQAVGRAVVESLAWLLLLLEEASDDEVDPDVVVGWTESATNPLWRLSTPQRQELAAFCRALAEDADNPNLREALLQLISGADLDHDYGT